MRKQRLLEVLLIAICAFLGGAAVQTLIGNTDALAGALGLQQKKLQNDSDQTLIHQYIDKKGINRFDLGIYHNSALQNLYAEDGTLRAQMGIYTQPGEKGLPFIALSDNQARIRLLFRLAGTNESPVLVFKDKTGRDRMVIGLALSEYGEEPFLAYYNNDGTRHMAFGKY